MLKFSPFQTKNGTIRHALLSARDAMLPEELARDPLARWILSFDPLQGLVPEPRLKMQPQPTIGSDVEEISWFKRPRDRQTFQSFSKRDDPYDLLIKISAEEAVNFYFASLFHLGRVLSSANTRLDAIQRLLDARNLNSSAARVHQHLDMDAVSIQRSLTEMSNSEVEYQSSRRRFALNCWEKWRASVSTLRKLLGSEAGQSLLLSDVGAGLCFLVCSRDTGNLLMWLGADRQLFRAVPLPSVSQRLQIIASSQVKFTNAFSPTGYWNLVRDRLFNFEQHPKFGREEPGKPFDQGVGGGWSSLYTPVPRPSSEIGFFSGAVRSANLQSVLRKITKLFLVEGGKPPIWPAAKNEAKRTWVVTALDQAGVSAEFLINDFAEQLLRFSAEMSETQTARFPFADSDWNAYLNSFFNTLWVPNLRHQLKKVGHERFVTIVRAAARLLDAMGYSVHPASDATLPPGAGEKHDSDQFPKPFDHP